MSSAGRKPGSWAIASRKIRSESSWDEMSGDAAICSFAYPAAFSPPHPSG
jgi:hypothetical protein